MRAMTETEIDILNTIILNPGLKGSQIACRLKLEKRTVNSILFHKLSALCAQDEMYRWRLRKHVDIKAANDPIEFGSDEIYEVGERYYWGHSDVDKSPSLAVKYYLLAADLGHVDAMYSLGYCFKHGIGVQADDSIAVNWYKIASRNGCSFAQNDLALMYEKGRGIEQDYSKALYYYQKAAKQNYDIAQYNLGRVYEQGILVNQNYREAARWYQLAANNGYEDAEDALKRVKEFSQYTSKLSVVALDTIRNPEKKIFVSYGPMYCQRMDHEILNTIAIVRAIETNEPIRIPVCQCVTCQDGRFFVSRHVIEETERACGKLLFNRVDVPESHGDGDYYDMLSDESLLHSLGYTVSAKEGYSDTARQDLLRRIIQDKKMTKHRVMNHLEYLMRKNENNTLMNKAIEKWHKDYDFVAKLLDTTQEYSGRLYR